MDLQGHACDLLDGRDGDLLHLGALELEQRVEDDAADVEVEAHAYRVAGHHDRVLIALVIEQLGLLPPRLRRECPVYHAHPTHTAHLPLQAELDSGFPLSGAHVPNYWLRLRPERRIFMR